MRLVVHTPEETVFESTVGKIVAESTSGFFGMLEHHIDFVAALVPGILSYEGNDGTKGFIGTGDGILVKCGAEVSVAVRRAAIGDDFAELRSKVAEEFLTLDETESIARGALARLEASVMRRMLELERTQ